MTDLIDIKKLNRILYEESQKTIEKYHLFNDMSESELHNTMKLFANISNNDIDTLIIHLQFLKQIRQRKYDKEKTYKFCDKCNLTHTVVSEVCYNCKGTLRVLPIILKRSYLLDGEGRDNNIIV